MRAAVAAVFVVFVAVVVAPLLFLAIHLDKVIVVVVVEIRITQKTIGRRHAMLRRPVVWIVWHR